MIIDTDNLEPVSILKLEALKKNIELEIDQRNRHMANLNITMYYCNTCKRLFVPKYGPVMQPDCTYKTEIVCDQGHFDWIFRADQDYTSYLKKN